MSTSFANVTASWNRNPPNYNIGETATATITGQAHQTPSQPLGTTTSSARRGA